MKISNIIKLDPGKAFLAIFVLVFLVHTGTAVFRNQLTTSTTPYNEQYRMARYLLHGSGFVCPVGPERDDPSSWYAPGYVSLMTAVMTVFGEATKASLTAIRLLNIAAFAVSAALYYLIARRLFGQVVGWLSVVLICFSPALLYKSSEVWDTNWTMLGGAVLLALCVLKPPRRKTALFASGIGFGAVAMINPCWTLCYPFWVIYGWWQKRDKERMATDFIRYAGLIVIGFGIAITPWTIRNYATFGDLFYLRGNLPMELWVGNAPWSTGYFFSKSGERIHPVFDEKEAERMVKLGEWGYFQACAEDVAEWWENNPGRFFKLGARRMRWFWFGKYNLDESFMRQSIRFASTAAPGALAILGAVFVLWRYRKGWVLVATAAVFPLAYYVSLFMVRYRLPLEPLLLTLAALSLVEIARFLYYFYNKIIPLK